MKITLFQNTVEGLSMSEFDFVLQERVVRPPVTNK